MERGDEAISGKLIGKARLGFIAFLGFQRD